jgi:hypothetical protein
MHDLIGNWMTEVRETKSGPMTFVFRFANDGTMEALARPAEGSGAKELRRNGMYQLVGDQLMSPAINEGQPVNVWSQSGTLILKFDAALIFELKRQ